MKLISFAFTMLFIASGLQAQKQISFEEMKTFTKGSLETKEFDSYLATDNHVYKIGDTVIIGRPSSNKTFAFLQQGSGVLTPIEPVYANASGSKTVIKKIYVGGTRRMGFKIYFSGKGVCGICPNYYIDVEQALSTNEIESFGMTKDKAIAKLKEAKELFDLGIISKEDYEKTKSELTPFITGVKN